MDTIYSRWSANIAGRYGCKQGWIRHYVFLLVQHLGGYRRFENIDWKRVTRLVFVCKGNICRSPYSEARARSFGIAASSFGLRVDGINPVNPTAFKVGRQRQVDLSAHCAKSANHVTLLPGDLLIAMEPWQGKQLLFLSNGAAVQVTLLGLWHSKPRPHIEDPCGLREEYFENCFSIIDEAIYRIASIMGIRCSITS